MKFRLATFNVENPLPPREGLNRLYQLHLREKCGAITALGLRPGFYVSATSLRISEPR